MLQLQKLLVRRSKIIVIAGLVGAGIVFVLSLLFPLEYRADAQVFIISRTRTGVDPFTVIRSAERVGENLVQIMKTDDFYHKVLDQEDFSVDASPFERMSDRKRRKKWANTIEPSVVFGTGVLNVSAYSKDKGQAVALAGAASQALVRSGWEYVGGDVTIKEVNSPIVTRFPARPNIVLNVILGFIIGSIGMAIVVIKKAS